MDFLIRTAFVRVISDLNVDVSLRIEIKRGDSNFELALSCIRPWAMLWRQSETCIGKMIVEEGASDVTGEENELIVQLKAFGFVLVTRAELLVPVNVTLHDTSPEETRVYHVLFSDLGTTPPFLR